VFLEFSASLIRSFSAVWDRLTRPVVPIQDIERHRQSQLLASLLLAVGLAMSIALPFRFLAPGNANWFSLRALVGLNSVLLLLYAYWQSRRGKFETAGMLAVVYGSAAIFVTALVIGDSTGVTSLYFLILVILFCTLFFSTRVALVVFGFHFAGLLLVPLITSEITFGQIIGGPGSFYIVSAITTQIFARHREQLEAIRKQRLSESEERYKIISELISDYALSADVLPDGSADLEWVTESFARVTGYTLDEVEALRGTSQWFLFHPEDHDAISQDMERLLAGESPVSEYRIVTKSGEMRWLRVHRRPVWNEDHSCVIHYYAVAQDITERRHAEDALRQSEERYKIISELISDYAFCSAVTEDGQFAPEWITESFTRVTGYAYDEISDLERDPLLYYPEDHEVVLADIESMLTGASTSGEYRIITRDGEMRWLHIHRRPVWDENHTRIIRYYAVAQDITERKQAEAQKLNFVLERERLTLMSRFVMAISHDFRNSLANIETSRYLLHRILANNKEPIVLAKLENIQDAVNRLTEQLENLHVVSSLVSTNTEPCNLNAIVDELVAEHVSTARAKNQHLVFQPEAQLPSIVASEEELKRALQHLLINALSYTPAGGTITVSTSRAEGLVIVEVKDTGPGIHRAHLPHLFELFYRADSARALHSGGVGLGLSIAKMIAEGHGGDISVESTVGIGSTFRLSLPIIQGESEPVTSRQVS
jgi:PAS domain S-box-containing protein